MLLLPELPQHGVVGRAPVGGTGGGRRVGGHQTRWMMFIRDVHTGSPVAESLTA